MAIKKKKPYLPYIIATAILFLIAVAVIKNKYFTDNSIKVTAENPQKRSIIQTVAASGKIFPVTEIKISSDVSGEIVNLFVQEGDSVVTNQKLAKINADAYQSQVERGNASLQAAQANFQNTLAQIENLQAQKKQIDAQLAQAYTIHQRNLKLYSDGVISKADLENSQTNLDALQANFNAAQAGIKAASQSSQAAKFNVESAKASVKELNTSLTRTTLFAPHGGIVSMLNVEKGERIVGNQMMVGTEILRIADLNQMEVRVEVTENDIPQVSLDDYTSIEVDAYPNRKFDGKVTHIAHSADNAISSLTSDQVTNFVVTISILPSSYQDLIQIGNKYPFRPGMSATVEVHTNKQENTLSIPIQAVTTRDHYIIEGKKDSNIKTSKDKQAVEMVFIIEADTVRYQPVTTGIQDSDFIEIINGLMLKNLVLTGPYDQLSRKLKQGDKIKIVEAENLFNDN